MAGYVASARLQGGVPRFVGGGTAAAWSAEVRLAADALGTDDPDLAAGPVELVGRPLDEALGDWLGSVGESWSQLTFYLFDPDSWR